MSTCPLLTHAPDAKPDVSPVTTLTSVSSVKTACTKKLMELVPSAFTPVPCAKITQSATHVPRDISLMALHALLAPIIAPLVMLQITVRHACLDFTILQVIFARRVLKLMRIASTVVHRRANHASLDTS